MDRPVAGLVDRVQAGLVGPADPVPQLTHLEGSRVTTNRVKLAQTPANPPVNPQLPTPKLNLPG